MGYKLKAHRIFAGAVATFGTLPVQPCRLIGLNAQIAGEFAVEARAAVDGTAWRSRMGAGDHSEKAKQRVSDAADAGITASRISGSAGFRRRISRCIAGRARQNWLNMIQRIRDLSDFKPEGGGWTTGKQFIETWIRKAFDELSQTEFADCSSRAEGGGQLRKPENSAVTVRSLLRQTGFSDRAAGQAGCFDVMGQAARPGGWRAVAVLQQLTDGELRWILGQISRTRTAI